MMQDLVIDYLFISLERSAILSVSLLVCTNLYNKSIIFYNVKETAGFPFRTKIMWSPW